jgi:hypothetical protein
MVRPLLGCSMSFGPFARYVIMQEALQGVLGRVLPACYGATRDGVTDNDTLVRTALLGASLRLSTKMHKQTYFCFHVFS